MSGRELRNADVILLRSLRSSAARRDAHVWPDYDPIVAASLPTADRRSLREQWSTVRQQPRSPLSDEIAHLSGFVLPFADPIAPTRLAASTLRVLHSFCRVAVHRRADSQHRENLIEAFRPP